MMRVEPKVEEGHDRKEPNLPNTILDLPYSRSSLVEGGEGSYLILSSSQKKLNITNCLYSFDISQTQHRARYPV